MSKIPKTKHRDKFIQHNVFQIAVFESSKAIIKNDHAYAHIILRTLWVSEKIQHYNDDK